MEHNDEFEREMRRALGRVDAPEGFAERVAARARGLRRPRGLPFARPAWRVVYAAAALLAITAGSVHIQHVRQTDRRAAEARQQFARAMDLTDHALDRVAAQLQQTEVGQLTAVLEGRR